MGRDRWTGARLSRALYRRLLAVYPRGFRDRFGERMLDDFTRMYRERVRAQGLWGVARLWRLVVLDTVRAAFREHREQGVSRSHDAQRGTPGGSEPEGAPRADSRRGHSRLGEGRMTVGNLIPELRTAVRGLTRRPGYSLVAVTTLALAIGANTALFSVLHAVLLRPLPYPEPDRLALLSESAGGFGNVSYPNYRDWKERTRSFAEMGAFSWTTLTVTGGSEPLRVTAGRADPSFMRAAGLAPAVGRGFVDEENAPGAASVAILSHSLWTQTFGADRDIVGETVSLDGSPFEVVGVLEEGADFAESSTALWIPLVPAIGDWVERREVHALTVLGRLIPDVTMESARVELERLSDALAGQYPEANAGRGATLRPLEDALLGDAPRVIWLLMGMVGLVLLIACANLAGLFLVRLTSRRDELAMRRALGASRWDVMRLLLLESLGLTLAGGALGVALAYSVVGPVSRLLQGRLPRIGEVSVDTTVLLFALGLSLVTGLLFGLLPGITADRRGASARPVGGRGSAEGGRTAIRVRSALSAAQVAGAVVLLVGAGLLMRSFLSLQDVDVGFVPENLATMAVSLSGTGRDVEEVVQFYRELPALLETLPGIESAAAVNALPISGGDSDGTVTIDGRPFGPGEAPTASYRRITPGYFETMGTPILHGRAFEDSDVGEPMVTIINESMAELLWRDPADAVGARIKVGSPDYEPWLTVVGVAGDIRNVGLDTEPRLATYEPHAQRPWTTMSLVLRTDGDPALVTDAIRRRVREAGGEIPVYDFATLGERIAESLRPRRIGLVLTGAFALLTLLTASIGVYGVLAYSVAQRTRELGVRLALGAGETRLMWTVAGQAAHMVLGGIALGLVAAVGLGGVLESLLHGVSPYDAATFLAVPLTLALVGAVACFVPARRAARIDPATSLRSD